LLGQLDRIFIISDSEAGVKEEKSAGVVLENVDDKEGRQILSSSTDILERESWR